MHDTRLPFASSSSVGQNRVIHLSFFHIPLRSFTWNDDCCDDVGDDSGAAQAAEHYP